VEIFRGLLQAALIALLVFQSARLCKPDESITKEHGPSGVSESFSSARPRTESR
jgi:hypothetical protein